MPQHSQTDADLDREIAELVAGRPSAEVRCRECAERWPTRRPALMANIMGTLLVVDRRKGPAEQAHDVNHGKYSRSLQQIYQLKDDGSVADDKGQRVREVWLTCPGCPAKLRRPVRVSIGGLLELAHFWPVVLISSRHAPRGANG